jgi:multidrug resistance efflux pump
MTEETEGEIYTHPNIREIAHEELIFRLDNIRNRRLVAAIEYKALATAKKEKATAKLRSQYEALSDKIRRNLNKVDEQMETIDRDLGKLVELGHRMSISAEEI